MAPAGYGSRVEGVHAVAAAAAAGRVRKLYVEEARRSNPAVEEILDTVGAGSVRVLDDVRSVATTDASQGLVAECAPITSRTLEELAQDLPALLALDHLEDPHNVGAMARSASAAGVSGMVLSSRRAAPLSAAAFKAAAGALETLPVAIVSSVPEALSRLKALGIWIVGLATSGGESLFDLDLLTEAVAVVVGGESSGLSHLSRKRCDVLVSIPMVGDTESLNASVSGALASFEIMRVRHRPG